MYVLKTRASDGGCLVPCLKFGSVRYNILDIAINDADLLASVWKKEYVVVEYETENPVHWTS